MNKYNAKEILQSSMNCMKYASKNCEGCPYTTEEGYYGERTDQCFEVIMYNASTVEMAKAIVGVSEID